MPQRYSVVEKDQGVSTSGWRGEDEVSKCNEFEMSLELWLKMAITDFPECKRNNTDCRKLEKQYFFALIKGLNPGTKR